MKIKMIPRGFPGVAISGEGSSNTLSSHLPPIPGGGEVGQRHIEVKSGGQYGIVGNLLLLLLYY